MLSWVTKVAPENRKAEYLGFFSMINSTLWSFGPIPGGIVEAKYGSLGLFAFAAAATLASLGSVYAIYSRRSGGLRPLTLESDKRNESSSPESGGGGSERRNIV
jgi:hypothetical protein